MFKKKEKTPKVAESVAKARSFELSVSEAAKKSEKRAWVITVFSLVLTLIFGAAIMLMLPLKQEVPYVVYVDHTSGTSTVSRLQGDFKNNKITGSEAVNRSNIAQFVMARESYDWDLTNISSWNKVLAMSAGNVGLAYRNQFAENNPNNPNKIYGKNLSIRTKIRNIILVHGNGNQQDPTGATVYFDRYVYNKEKHTLQPLDKQVATMTFAYQPNLKMAEQYRYDNPLGFQVTHYQVDTDIIGKPAEEPAGNFPIVSQPEAQVGQIESTQEEQQVENVDEGAAASTPSQ
ncbi:virB8 family protein [Neisseria dentiae]|nr:type IV secretion system protein [Neisseria dentiae]QMT44347.1 type IV secretion system protein [Neisseria dentiae]STZ50033.1 Pertussis toxin liberation protein E [Neisseria dentiae]